MARRFSSSSEVSHGSDADSFSSASTTSLVFERLHARVVEGENKAENKGLKEKGLEHTRSPLLPIDSDPLYADEDDPFLPRSDSPDAVGDFSSAVNRRAARAIAILCALLLVTWLGTLVVFLLIGHGGGTHSTPKPPHDPGLRSRPSGNRVTLDQLLQGIWSPAFQDISWIDSPNGEDGLLLSTGIRGKDYLVVEDVRDGQQTVEGLGANAGAGARTKTLMKNGMFDYGSQQMMSMRTWPSPNHDKVLIATEIKPVWRHSFTAVYWLLDVATQEVEPLVPSEPDARIQLATWSPRSNSVMYTRDNNMWLRAVSPDPPSAVATPPTPVQITTDGGSEYFYGIPDWVCEEEVFGDRVATWWSSSGDFAAFLRTNETAVPEFPVPFYVSRPSGTDPPPGEGAYPDVESIKYPKAGAPNPVVELLFYDVVRGDVFSVDIKGGFADDDRLITNVLWTGDDKVVIKETNRVSDVLRVVLVDVSSRSGTTTRTLNLGDGGDDALGGWFEISQRMHYVPADPDNDRPHPGYIDTVIHDFGDHLAYFSPLDASEPVMLTSGPWEVVDSPKAVDLANNLVYFVATKESPIQRHVYSVRLDGTDMSPVTDTAEAYYDVTLSSRAGYALLTYQGPDVPWQKVVSTPANPVRLERLLEDNRALADRAADHELPLRVFGTLDVDSVALNYVERRPPNFDPAHRYPVLFFQYSGPGSQEVTKQFTVDFQSYVASSLGYVVVTVDGRGTGFIGRQNRVLVRGRLGEWESHDQVAAAQVWAAKPYVDPARIAIWGWSYGGYNTLKTLERDAGRTFSYGMAVAPVTDWRFYDSVYTERYMRTPAQNLAGYDGAAVANMSALGESVRFLLVHGSGDDNVHFQNSLTLLDRLDLAEVDNFDVLVFPDSNHGIQLHNARKMVFERLSNWLVNAFNGEWLHVADAEPKEESTKRSMKMQKKRDAEEKVARLVNRALV